jgi:hypothetical protein
VFRQINGVAAGTVDSDAVNVAQLKAVDSKASAGWNLQANGGTASNASPGGTVNVVNGNNINVTQNGNQLTIATADDVSFNSVTTGNTKLDTNTDHYRWLELHDDEHRRGGSADPRCGSRYGVDRRGEREPADAARRRPDWRRG